MSGIDNLKPFQKGNKAAVGHGRPKGKSMTSFIKKIADKDILFPNLEGNKENVSVAEGIALALAYKCLKGSAPHLNIWLDRMEGKVTNTIEIDDLRDKKAKDLTDEELHMFLRDEEE